MAGWWVDGQGDCLEAATEKLSRRLQFEQGEVGDSYDIQWESLRLEVQRNDSGDRMFILRVRVHA